jgi:predicted HD phosphohydrolase
MNDGANKPRATFKDMASCTREDWDIILPQYIPVDRLDHSLQRAGLAHADGRDEEYVVCALLHDMGDGLGPYNHADIAAAILKPFVSPENQFMVEKHARLDGTSARTA